MKLEHWPLAKLKPYKNNPRDNDKAIPQMVASIKEFGFAVPVLARKNGEVIDGHLRIKAAIAMDWKEKVPVILCDGWSKAQVKAFRLLVNRSVSWAEWDMEMLATEFAEIKAMDYPMEFTGFDAAEIDRATLGVVEGEDDVPEVPAVPVSMTGDLWQMGGHWLLCGDCTNADDVGRALAGHAPNIMATDPPYGVQYDPGWRVEAAKKGLLAYAARRVGEVTNDDRTDWSAAWALFPGNVVYCWNPAGSNSIQSGSALIKAGFAIRNMIIWSKPHFPIGRGDYHYRHEPCWYAVRTGSKSNWCGDRKQTTVWDVALDKNVEGGHSTQKPVELFRRPLLNHTVAGDSVYDPFLGSGTCIIAAEATGRLCYGLEISPNYCDVIVKRWQTFTGKTACNEDGETFDSITRSRGVVAA
jgi:DNA modification methylase